MPTNNGGRRSTAPMIVGWSLSLCLFFCACLSANTSEFVSECDSCQSARKGIKIGTCDIGRSGIARS